MADQKETIFVEGLRVFNKHDNAPDFVICSLVLTPNELLKWVAANPNHVSEFNGQKQVRVQLKKSREGKLYAEVDTFKKGDAPAAKTNSKPAAKNAPDAVDDLPF